MTKWIILAVGASLVALSGSVWVQTHRLQNERVAHEQTRTEYARYREMVERSAAEQAQRAADETARRLAAQQERVDAALEREQEARAAADRAATAGQRLRAQLATITANCRAASGNPAAPGDSEADAPTTDLLADVQRRLDEATDRIARFADDSHRAGLACQAEYEGLGPR